MPRGEKPFDVGRSAELSRSPHGPELVEGLFRFLASLMMRDFYGSVTIRLESGKVTHVARATRQTWEYDDLPVAREVKK
jgi:hypothetical protein